MSASIRDAGVADLPGILAIYNDAVGNTTAIWNETPVDLANRQAWFDTRARQGHPILVASDAAGEVLGYASYGDWRPFEGFRGTVEHSVYVRDDQRGKGLGVQLLQALIERARAQGLHVMVAAIESGNAASIGLHRRLGFEISGQMPQVGQKFGR
ncbi:TPA: N-acetyltransferase family protein [Pseudomonas aeruginosa]